MTSQSLPGHPQGAFIGWLQNRTTIERKSRAHLCSNNLIGRSRGHVSLAAVAAATIAVGAAASVGA